MRACVLMCVLIVTSMSLRASEPLDTWMASPESWKGAVVKDGIVTLTSDKWAYLVSPMPHTDVELTASITIREPGKHAGFFGQSWSVWPDKTFGDQGWDVGFLLRGGEQRGYRVQVSTKLQELAIVKYPDGGYVRSVPFPVKPGEPFALTATVRANRLTVSSGGKELVAFVDGIQPLPLGNCGFAVNSNAKVEFGNVTVNPLRPGSLEVPPPHQPNFSARRWIGGRLWVFDGAEPILLLPDPASSYINNVKLRPGVRPLLSFNSHWDVQNQGAYPEAKNETADVKTSGGGKELMATWIGKHEKDRFGTVTTMTVGFDTNRKTYTYDIDSELTVNPGQPFHFRYGYDFEHHTPLDPFNWQSLVCRKKDGTLYRRPVTGIDPGPQNDLETSGGLRVWHGRHADPVPVCPAVEYSIPEAGKRKLNTAVCAAFYDTGVSFEPETAAPGSKVHVRYRYTGYPTEESDKLFREAKIYDSPTLDPNHHYLFAEWPKQTFSQFVPLSETFAWGRVPFMTGHNQRPTYELAKTPGVGSGFAMKLGPKAFGAANLPMPSPLAPGKYLLSAKAKADNLHGPGGRIELTASDKSGKDVAKFTHFIGSGSFDWKTVGFGFELPVEAKLLRLGFGNAGTGDWFVTDAEIRLARDSDTPLPVNPNPPPVPAAPAGAVADYRLVEGRGLHVFDFAGGPFGSLELANLDWVKDGHLSALRFADRPDAKPIYPKAGTLDFSYLRHPGYKDRDGVPVALGGFHGGGFEWKAFSLVTWVKPAAAMGKSSHGGTGDILGVGARRIIFRLVGEKAPYQLQAAINVNDRFTATDAKLDADRWYQLAITGEPTAEKKFRIRLFVDGKLVHDGTTKVADAPLTLPPSVILGAEIFYFHNSYYRGLIGRTLIFDRVVAESELNAFKPKAE